MVTGLVIAAIVIVCAALTIAAARIATRNPALEAQNRELRAENARLSGLVVAIHKRAQAGADVNPELQVVCDLIDGAHGTSVIGKGQ